MIAICGGGMRTGSVAVYQLMRDVVESTNSGRESDGSILESKGTKWAMANEWVVCKQHRANSCIKPYIDRVRVVVPYRNQLDVLVSLMRFKKEPFNKVITDIDFFGNIDAYHGWIKLMPKTHVLPIRYEEGVIANRAETVLDIANFLGMGISPQQAAAIEDRWSVEANKKRAEEGNKIGDRDYMAKRHIYSGSSGAWRTDLTRDQIVAALRIKKVAVWQKEMGYEPQ